MNRSIVLFLACIFILLIISLIFSIPVIHKNSNYSKIEIYDKLYDSEVSLLQEKENTIEFVDKLRENSIEFYDEDLNNLEYSKFYSYCKITIYKDHQEAVKNSLLLKDQKKNIFVEKNILFYTNKPNLKEKYLRILRDLKGKTYD
jgi:outer membrane protein OmpA-like peptidoglycan-associated protein